MKTLKLSVILAMIAMAMTSCVKEQTSLELEDIPYSATIIGNVTYSDGCRVEASKQSTTEAKGLAVRVKVLNSEYTTNNTSYTVFSTTTDDKGNFRINIPCTLDGVDVTITTDYFEGLFYNSPTTLSYVIYRLEKDHSITNLTPNSIKVCKLSEFLHDDNPTIK